MRMTPTMLAACVCCLALASPGGSLPLSGPGFKSQALDRLMLVETGNDSAMRSKRTIGILRQLFPEVSKMIEDKVNLIIGEILKIFGPVVFKSLVAGNNKSPGGGSGAGGPQKSPGSGTTVEAKNPFDDEDDDENDTLSFTNDDDWFKPKDKTDDSSSKLSLAIPTEPSDEPTTTAAAAPSSTATTDKIDLTTTTAAAATTVSSPENVTLNAVQ